ncbi:hypothetical protein [Clostridium sp. KNHs216]|uniref:hypothetical protein n=1 Tax=Clostridium sp. KNHs216 TaxID=1550235 RepID=UPI0011530875|nr:hypothetical protein [Clostridium sp. KNHs216]TQI66750.1 hypothetical protein LY85_1422 [Clostridium sp. KNHs216]
MDLMALEREGKARERHPKYYENIDVLIVLNGFGQATGFYDAKQLARRWLKLGNDNFVREYGFKWVPPLALQGKVRLHL